MPEEKDLDLELIDKTDLEIDKVSQSELDERDDTTPFYKEKIDLTEDQVDRLKEEIFKEYEILKEERKGEGLDSNWDSLEAQYNGEMTDDANLEFNLDTGVTKIKAGGLEKFALKAFLESDPKFTVTPRPQMAKQDKWDVVVDRQAEYLDYKLDEEINIDSPLRKTLHQACNLDVGILKVPYAHIRKKRRREERYSGKKEQDEQSGQVRIPGLESFMRQYPEAGQPGNEGHWVVKELIKGKDVVFKAEFWETVYSDPKPAYVDCRDFYVSKDTEGYDGLCDARLTIEKQKYTWWELKRAEKNGDFENVDDVKAQINESGAAERQDNSISENEDYEHVPYYPLECVYHFNMVEDSDDPEDEVKIQCWFEEGSKAFLGANLYPYDSVDSYYVPFYIKDKKPGFYKGGISEDITDDHLIQNAMINFMLTESWQQLQTTPIVRQGSPIADQFINKQWKPGIPLEIPREELNTEKAISFLERPQRGVAAQLMNVIFFLGKITDDKTGISSLASGKESPTDPHAPASKTAMLLEQSGINISEYINVLLPSFNMVGEIILQLTYQMSEGGRMFRQKQRAGNVVGGDPFQEISRDQMVAKTNIQSRALGFAFDKINEKRENMALFQLLRADPIISQNPEGVYAMAKTLVESWSPLWKNKVDTLLPNPQEFQMNQMKIAVQALQLYMKQIQDKAQVTGVPGEPNFQEFAQMASQMMAQAITPQEPEKG